MERNGCVEGARVGKEVLFFSYGCCEELFWCSFRAFVFLTAILKLWRLNSLYIFWRECSATKSGSSRCVFMFVTIWILLWTLQHQTHLGLRLQYFFLYPNCLQRIHCTIRLLGSSTKILESNNIKGVFTFFCNFNIDKELYALTKYYVVTIITEKPIKTYIHLLLITFGSTELWKLNHNWQHRTIFV